MNMWAMMFFCIVLAFALLVLPGYPLLRLFGLSRTWSICSAPAITTSVVAVCSLVLCALGIPNNALTVAVLPCIAFLAIFALARDRITPLALPRIEVRFVVLFAVVGCLAGAFVFLRILPAPDAFAQAWDNVHHLNSIRSFAQSSAFNSLSQSTYMTAADKAIVPMPDAGYYPAVWHAICAMVLQITGAPGGLIENAVNFTLGALVFPLAMLGLFACMFGENRRFLALASIAVVSFPLFPWEMLAYGPLFANLASFACMPTSMWFIAHCISHGASMTDRARALGLFLISCAGIVFLQPNSVFTMAVLLAPLFVQRIAQIDPHACKSAALARIFKSRFISPAFLAVLFAVLCLIIWYLAYRAPFLANVVHSGVWHWQFARWQTTLFNILTLSYVGGFYTANAQIVGAVLVIVGIVRTFMQREHLWITIAYLIAVTTVFFSMSGTEELKALFAGFWYADPFRCGAMASIAAMPLLTLGGDWALSLLDRILKHSKTNNRFDGSRARCSLYAVACAAFVIVTFWPNASAQPVTTLPDRVPPNQEMSSASHVLARWYMMQGAPLDPEEAAFAERVMAFVGKDDLVINQPYDGSVFTYGQYGLRTYYRKSHGYGVHEETDQSRIIRDGICNVANDERVANACRDIGAQYIMLLKRSDMPQSFMNAQYYALAWEGVNEVNDGTPGLEIVLSEGEMRLYRIACL